MRLSNARRAVVGAATVLAAVGSAIVGYTSAEDELTGGIGGLAGGATVFVASILLARTDQRRADKRQALAARDSVLLMLPLPISLSGPSPAVSGASAAVLTTRAPSQLLIADRQAIGRPWGRSRDLERLQRWVQSPNSPIVGILTGPAGVGKTRLTIQLATSLKGSWVIGRLQPMAVGAIRAITACSEPTLVVIEANGWRPEIAAILDELAELDTANSYQVKLLLVSRHRDWLTYLRSQVRADTAGLIDAAKLLPLDQVGEREDLLRWYGEARLTFAELLGQPAPPKTGHGPLTGTTFGDLVSLAYASVVTSNTGAALSTAGEVADVLAEQERRQWPEPDVAITDELRVRIVAALTLRGGVDDAEQAASVIARIPELSDTSAERLRDLTRWAGRIYPRPNWFSMPVLELLTHGLTIPALRDRTLRKSLMSDLDVLTVARVGSFLIGAANAYPEAAVWITELLQPSDLPGGLAQLMFGSPGVPAPPQDRTDRLLAALISKITERTTLEALKPVLTDDIGYPRARLALLQALVAAGRTWTTDDKSAAHQADLAAALTDLAGELHDFGRYDEALTACQEAVTLLRPLAVEQPNSHKDARALAELVDQLCHLGRYAEALVADQEAVQLVGQSGNAQSDRYQHNLARVLRSHGQVLDNVGRYDEALAADQEAVTQLRELADEDPTSERDLARGLTSLAVGFGNVGRYEEALDVEHEAVRILRELAAEQPARHQSSLAEALTNLGNFLSDVGRHEEALVAEHEAVAIQRQLAIEQPARRLSGLAHALTNLGSVAGIGGRHDVALDAEHEAVRILRELAAEQPARQPNLAYALTNLGAALDHAGRYEEALDVEHEAVRILRELAAEQPARHLPPLAHALTNRGGTLRTLGRYQEAFANSEEAVSIRRKLADDRPARHLRDLALALANLGGVLSDLGRDKEALATYKESRTLSKAVASDEPWHAGDITNVDLKIRNLLRDLGREEESINFAL